MEGIENIKNNGESKEKLPDWWDKLVNNNPSSEDLLHVADSSDKTLSKEAQNLLEEHELSNYLLINIMGNHSNDINYKEWAFEKGVSQGFTENELFEIVDRCPDFLDRAKKMIEKKEYKVE